VGAQRQVDGLGYPCTQYGSPQAQLTSASTEFEVGAYSVMLSVFPYAARSYQALISDQICCAVSAKLKAEVRCQVGIRKLLARQPDIAIDAGSGAVYDAARRVGIVV